MTIVEKFDISKAYHLQMSYKKSRKVAKQKLVEELISWQHFFGTTSITGVKISLPCCYRKSTVESVLNDLGYNLDYFSTSIQRGLYGETYGRNTNFSFSVPGAK